jgi:hypothetical protein
MLDSAHPDRQSCVGNRGKGDTDMVKLRLFNCVRNFLSDGAGDQFFGENVENPGQDEAIEAARVLGEEKAPSEGKLLWPQDGNRIISLVTPLLRRMVTNERQRMYAIETRKGGAKKKEVSVEEAAVPDTNTQGMNDRDDINHQVEHLKTPNLPSHLHPLASAQSQSQQHYSTSSVTSLSVQSPNNTLLVNLEPAMKYKEAPRRHQWPVGFKLKLPQEPPAEPVLEKVNIFVTKVIPPWRGNKKPTPTLLQVETRLENSKEAPLFYMTWEELQYIVKLLVRDAVWLYPALEPPAEDRPLLPEVTSSGTVYEYLELQPSSRSLSPPSTSSGMGPEALRGLAVAATEIQDDASENANNLVEQDRSATAENPFLDLPKSTLAENPFADPSTSTSPAPAPAPAPADASMTVASPTTPTIIVTPASSSPPSPNTVTPTTLSPTGQTRVVFVEPHTFPPEKRIPTTSLSRRPVHRLPEQRVPVGMQRPSTVLSETRLPKWKIETQWTMGLRTIANREEWHEVKLDLAYAIWADKVMNLVVTIP